MEKSKYLELKNSTQYDYLGFCSRLLIPCYGTQVKRFSEVAEPWQIQDAVMFNNIIGNLWGKSYPYSNIWLTRPRGHDKTSSIARLVLWCIVFQRDGVPPLNIYTAAVDKDQARLLLDSVEEIVKLNGFNKLVKISHKGVAKSFGGTLHVLSSDASSSYGLRPNILVFDEISHWDSNRSKRFFDALWSGRAKMGKCITIVITNAGYKNTWQYNLLCSLKKRPDWYIYDEPGRLASWHSDTSDVAFGLPDSEYRRLINNEWVSDISLSIYDDFLKCISDLRDMPDINSCSRIIISVDYASSQDLTAVTLSGVHSGTMYIYDIQAGRPGLDELERTLLQMHSRYISKARVDIVADVYQMEYVAVRMQKNYGIHVHLFKPTTRFNKVAISNMVSAMQMQRITFSSPYLGEFAGETLDTEMRNIEINLKAGKVNTKIDGVHDDRFHSVMYALQHAIDTEAITPTVQLQPVSGIQEKPFVENKIFSRIEAEMMQTETPIFGVRARKDERVLYNPYQINLQNISRESKQRKET